MLSLVFLVLSSLQKMAMLLLLLMPLAAAMPAAMLAAGDAAVNRWAQAVCLIGFLCCFQPPASKLLPSLHCDCTGHQYVY